MRYSTSHYITSLVHHTILPDAFDKFIMYTYMKYINWMKCKEMRYSTSHYSTSLVHHTILPDAFHKFIMYTYMKYINAMTRDEALHLIRFM